MDQSKGVNGHQVGEVAMRLFQRQARSDQQPSVLGGPGEVGHSARIRCQRAASPFGPSSPASSAAAP